MEWEALDDERPRRAIEDFLDKELLESETIVLHGELKEELCHLVCKKLLYLASKGVKRIKIILSSAGGEVFHGLLLYNLIEDLKREGIEVIIEVKGLAASMAMVILQSASLRRVSKFSRLLIHEISSWTFGKASEVKEESEELQRVNMMLIEILSKRSKLTKKGIAKRIKKRDWWLSPEEALKYGLVDEVV